MLRRFHEPRLGHGSKIIGWSNEYDGLRAATFSRATDAAASLLFYYGTPSSNIFDFIYAAKIILDTMRRDARGRASPPPPHGGIPR